MTQPDDRTPAIPDAVKSFVQHDLVAWGGLAIGALGLCLSILSLYLQSKEDRDVTVVAADRGSTGTNIRLGITYRNAGDITEVVTDTVLTIVNSDGKTDFYRVNLDPCLEPVILPADSALHRAYSVKVPLFARPIPAQENRIPQRLLLEVYTSSNGYSPIRTTFTAGFLYREPKKGLVRLTDIVTRPKQLRLRGLFGASDYDEVRKLPRSSTCSAGAL
jgi:hypothetical protein